MADGGYDVADYRDIDPMFGTLAEAERLIEEAAALGIRVIVDVVPNHCSDRHVWFQQALAADPGSPERDRFWFRPGRGANGELPPNEWSSIFGGSAWTRTQSTNGTPDEWYLHLFAPQQPDLNWDNDDVRHEHEEVLRFWFDRGVAGVRIDSAALLFKDAALPDFDPDDAPSPHPFSDRDELHDVYRSWRALADALWGRPHSHRGNLAAGRGALRALPSPGRDAQRVQLRFPRVSVGRSAAACVHRLDARGACACGRSGNVGALEPRCDPPRDSVRA